MIEKIERIHKDFIWDSKKSKMEHSSMIGDYEEGGLKDIFSIIINIHGEISLLRLCSSFIIDVLYSNTILEKNPNLPLFYKNMIEAWNRMEQEPLTPETVLIQPVWFNRYIKIVNEPIQNFLKTPILISDIYAENGSITPWTCFKTKLQIIILNGCKQLM